VTSRKDRAGRSAADEYRRVVQKPKDTGTRTGRTRDEYPRPKGVDSNRLGRTRDEYPKKPEKAPKKDKVSATPKKSKARGTVGNKVKGRQDKAIRKIRRKRPKTNPPKPAKTTVKTEPSKTTNTVNLLAWDNQDQELLNAYISMAGTELFQYSNSQTIDGAYNDVAIINVLSRRRQQYTPNRIIEQAQVYVKSMWIENGHLCLDVDDPDHLWDDCVLLFRVGTSSTTIAETVN
jgi:hypothetical protein